MSSDQLDLFSAPIKEKRKGVLVPFPSSARAGKIRQTAAVLKRKNGRDAERYWRQVTSGIFNQLLRSGIAREVAHAELMAFQNAVQAELWRIYDRGEATGDQPA